MAGEHEVEFTIAEETLPVHTQLVNAVHCFLTQRPEPSPKHHIQLLFAVFLLLWFVLNVALCWTPLRACARRASTTGGGTAHARRD